MRIHDLGDLVLDLLVTGSLICINPYRYVYLLLVCVLYRPRTHTLAAAESSRWYSYWNRTGSEEVVLSEPATATCAQYSDNSIRTATVAKQQTPLTLQFLPPSGGRHWC
jgi:hypothetical protein